MTTLAVAPELASSMARHRTSASSAALAALEAGYVAPGVNRWATKLLMATTRPCDPRARQSREIASIRKPRGMDDRVDAPERGARRGNKLGCRPGICQLASPPRDLGAGLLTVQAGRF